MKKIVFIICFTMLLKPVIPVFDYMLNYEYIANELCENKDKPIMGCNGKCYLMKELAKASETEKPISSGKKHTTTETTDLFLADCTQYEFSTSAVFSSSKLNAPYCNLYTHLQTSTCFHPPTLIS